MWAVDCIRMHNNLGLSSHSGDFGFRAIGSLDIATISTPPSQLNYCTQSYRGGPLGFRTIGRLDIATTSARPRPLMHLKSTISSLTVAGLLASGQSEGLIWRLFPLSRIHSSISTQPCSLNYIHPVLARTLDVELGGSLMQKPNVVDSSSQTRYTNTNPIT
jgi:hypothetical protein